MRDYFDLTDQVAIVTGASRGIGRAIALALAQAGAHVVGCARNTSLLNDLVEEIGQIGGDAVGLKVDLKHYDDVKSMADAVIDKFGKVDILVNNAGVVLLKPLVESSEDEWRNVIDTNLIGCFYCCIRSEG